MIFWGTKLSTQLTLIQAADEHVSVVFLLQGSSIGCRRSRQVDTSQQKMVSSSQNFVLNQQRNLSRLLNSTVSVMMMK